MPGVEDIVAGAALGTALQLLCEEVINAKAKAKTFKRVLDSLQNTLILLNPMVIKFEKLNQELMDYSRAEIGLLLGTINKARQLVSICSEIPRWNKLKKYRYRRRLIELDSSLRKLLKVEFQAAELRDILTILSEVNKMNHKLDRMNLHDKSCSNSTIAAKQELPNYPASETTGEVKEDYSSSSSEDKPSNPRVKIEYKRKTKRSKLRLRIHI